MLPHWPELKTLFGLLAYMVKRADPDGIELYFTISDIEKRSKNTTNLTKILERHRPNGTSNIRLRLNSILQAYKAKLNHDTKHNLPSVFKGSTPKAVRSLNLYIFTDGVWQPDCQAADLIRLLVDEVINHKLPKEQIGIQFISFGNDPLGIARLGHLDSELKLPMYVASCDGSSF